MNFTHIFRSLQLIDERQVTFRGTYGGTVPQKGPQIGGKWLFSSYISCAHVSRPQTVLNQMNYFFLNYIFIFLCYIFLILLCYVNPHTDELFFKT